AIELLQNGGRSGIAEQAPAYLELGGVDGDVEGREMLVVNLLPVGLAEVGERNEVRRQERVAIVIVFDVQRAAQACRRLIDEAEDAVVVADANAIRRRLRKLEAQAFRADVDAAPRACTSLALPDEVNGVGRGVEVDVDHVAHRMAVDRDERIAGAQADLLRDTPRPHRLDGQHTGESLPGSPRATVRERRIRRTGHFGDGPAELP